jgi:hypothetical protein
VGCDERGPFPGVGGRGVSGGESGGAGIDVPSVREKLIGVSVNGLYLPPAMVDVVVVRCLGRRRGCWRLGELAQDQLMAVGYVIVIGDQSQKPQAGGSSGGALERRVRHLQD